MVRPKCAPARLELKPLPVALSPNSAWLGLTDPDCNRTIHPTIHRCVAVTKSCIAVPLWHQRQQSLTVFLYAVVPRHKLRRAARFAAEKPVTTTRAGLSVVIETLDASEWQQTAGPGDTGDTRSGTDRIHASRRIDNCYVKSPDLDGTIPTYAHVE